MQNFRSYTGMLLFLLVLANTEIVTLAFCHFTGNIENKPLCHTAKIQLPGYCCLTTLVLLKSFLSRNE